MKHDKPVEPPKMVALRGWAEGLVQNLIKLEKEKGLDTAKRYLAVQMNVGTILEKSMDCENKNFVDSLKNVPDDLAGIAPKDEKVK